MNNSNSGLIIHCDFYIKVVSVFINSHIYVPSGKYYLPFCPYSFSVISFLKMFIYFCCTGSQLWHVESSSLTKIWTQLPWWLRWYSICLQCGRPGFDSWVGKIPWRRKWQSTPALLAGKSHGQRSLIGYSPWGRKELDTTERFHFPFTFLSPNKEK